MILFQSKLKKELEEIYYECSCKGWDGENAPRISIKCLQNCYIFLSQLPFFSKTPSLAPCPSGSIAFEWYKDKRNLVNIDISKDNYIMYVMRKDGEYSHGKYSLYNKKAIRKLIKSI